MTKINGMNYDELSEHITRAIEELQYKAYEEGYKQGKFDVRMEGIFGKVHEETPQQKRDRIVEQAKADVSKLEGLYLDDYHYGDYVVNRKKRTIVALIKPIKDLVNQKIYKGIAKCQPSDCFNVHIGKAIALRRALGLEVSAEYLNAPQPTRVRVGDIIEVRMPSGKTEQLRIVDKDISEIGEDECSLYSAAVTRGRIVEEGE